MLSQMEYNCLSCDEKFKRSEQKIHLSVCKGRTYDCPMCGVTKIKNLEDHWTNKCSKVNLTCIQCQTMLQRDGIPHHNCLESLLKERVLEQETIAKQKAEIEMLKAKMNQCQCGALKKCQHGHKLRLRTDSKRRANGNPGLSITCDVCRGVYAM